MTSSPWTAAASFDPDEEYPLTFAWTLVGQPGGSAATLAGADTESPSFTADRAGTYTAELVVTDSGGDSSAPDQVMVSTINTAPVADAGEDQSITLDRNRGSARWKSELRRRRG